MIGMISMKKKFGQAKMMTKKFLEGQEATIPTIQLLHLKLTIK